LANSFTLATGCYFFYQNCFHVPELLRQKNWPQFFLLNVLIFLSAYVLSSIFYTTYLLALGEGSFQLKHLFMTSYPYRSNAELPILYALGLVLGHIKKVHTLKILKTSAAFLLLGALSFFLYQASYKDKKIEGVQVFNQQFQSIEEIISQPELRDKTVYIDLWYSSCSPCIEQMKIHLPTFKKEMEYANIPVEYVYLGRETSHPNSKQRWWNAIEKLDLKGWHYYFEKQDTELLWKSILPHLEKKGKRAYGFPHYLIARNGEIIEYDAPSPEKLAEIKEIIELKK
jgi:hypothetical protein